MTDPAGILENKERYRKVFLLLLVAAVTAAFVAMVRRFLVAMLLAAIFAGLLSRLYARFLRLCRGRRPVASALTVLVFLLVLLVPLLGVLGVVVAQAIRVTHAAGPWIQEQIEHPDVILQWMERLPFMDRLQLSSAEILTKVGQAVSGLGGFLVGRLSDVTRMTASFLLQLFLFVYTLFYFLMDGQKLLQRILLYIPLSHEDEVRMLRMFVSVTRATLKGVLVIGVVQGVLAGLALAVVGIPSVLFWTTLMTVFSMIPGVGAGIIWLPASIYLLVTHRVAAGIGLILFCAVVVGSLDNLLRPRLVGRDAQMPDLLIFFSVLGGLLLFGMVGLLLGPILASLFVIVWDIYGVVFRDVLPEPRGLNNDPPPPA